MDTEDPYTVIEHQLTTSILSYKLYKAEDGDNWIIFGKCNCCGQCQLGINHNTNIRWTGIPAGQPGAEYDITFHTRKDIPVRPEIKRKCPDCSLWGYYLR